MSGATEGAPTLETRAARLAWAIANHGPGERTPREFQRAVRGRAGRVPASFFAVRGYLDGKRPIPEAFCDVAAQVLGPVTGEWLKYGDGGAPELEESRAGPPSPPELPDGETEDPYAEIRHVVEQATREPSEEALRDLDPEYPRGGDTLRNWQITYDIVTGRSVLDIAAEVELSPARVVEILDEYWTLVKRAAGMDTA